MVIKLFIPVISLLLSIIATWFIKQICIYHGIVEFPRKERWHKNPVAKFGGIAIFIAILVSIFLLDQFNNIVIFISIGSTFIFFIGLVDDLRGVSPTIKLISQIILGIFAYTIDLKFFSMAPPYISFPLTILWVVGIINAMNLLDNMDGLCSGIAAIITLVISFGSYIGGNILLMQLSLIITGACIGFLIFNFNPAKIFMGDAGSMLLGFLLATLSLYAIEYRSSNLAVSLFLPVMVMAIPIFDTSLVTIERIVNRRKISVGGKDHTSHRLVKLGLSERKAVLFLYIISGCIGSCALIFELFDIQLWLSIVVLFLLSMFFLGAFLSTLKVYPDVSVLSKDDQLKEMREINWLINTRSIPVFFKQGFEMIIDMLLITVSYTISYFLRYEFSLTQEVWNIYSSTLPYVLLIQISILSIFGIYRDVWRYVSIPNLLTIIKSITISFVIIIIYFSLFVKSNDYSKTLLVINLLLTTLLISGSRLFYRLMMEFFTEQSDKTLSKNLLIIGSGQAGNEVLRSIMNNVDLNYNIIGFIDDNRKNKDLSIQGIPILGTTNELSEIIKKEKIHEVIISMDNKIKDKVNKIITTCKKTNTSFKRAKWIIDKV